MGAVAMSRKVPDGKPAMDAIIPRFTDVCPVGEAMYARMLVIVWTFVVENETPFD
jgi:hypothetical protein